MPRKGDKSLHTETLGLVQTAIHLLEEDKVANPAPYSTKDEALGFFYYAHGFILKDSKPADAVADFLKVAKSNTPFKNEPTTYYFLGQGIMSGQYDQLAAEYEKKFAGKEVTPESTAMFDRLNQLADRVIDLYARAAALCTRPEQQGFKKTVVTQLKEIYKDRHNSEVGLDELISSALNKPLP